MRSLLAVRECNYEKLSLLRQNDKAQSHQNNCTFAHPLMGTIFLVTYEMLVFTYEVMVFSQVVLEFKNMLVFT